jgi:hypothetical protein
MSNLNHLHRIRTTHPSDVLVGVLVRPTRLSIDALRANVNATREVFVSTASENRKMKKTCSIEVLKTGK